MTIVPFGEYLPDLPALGNPGATVAKNVIPHVASYKPFASPVTYSDALDDPALGAASALDTGGATHTYAGDESKLYRLVDTTWTDSSKSGGYSVDPDERWSFLRWGNDVIASAAGEPVQKITMGGTTFADLFTSTLKPKARHMAVVRNFLVLGNTDEGTAYPNRVRWSAKDDPANMDATAANQGGYHDLRGSSRGSGWIQAIVGREYGMVFQEHSIWRMTYSGSPDIFTFDEVETNRGAFVPGGVIDYGRLVFYLSEDGFYLFDGTQSIPIGKNKVDRTFFNELDQTYKYRITSCIDPTNSVVMWSYTTGNSAGGGDPDKIIMFNWSNMRWSFAEVDHELIFPSLTAGYTLEGLDDVSTDLDALGFSLDSRVWTGGAAQLSMFDRDHQLAHFTGVPLDAVLETAETQMTPSGRTLLTGVRPLIDGTSPTVTVQVGTRNLQTASNSFGSAASLNDVGICPVRADARYHRLRVNVSGTFRDAIGFDIEDGHAVVSGDR